MPAPTMLFAIGVELLIVDILRILNVPAPCRISSLPMGAPLRPGVYAYIEDICAVDGSGGTEFRQRLNLRYQASKAFREMLHRQTLFWAIGAIVCSAVCTAIIFTIQRDAAYVVSLPWPAWETIANVSGRLGPSIPLGRRMDRHHHPVGATGTRTRVRNLDHGQVEGLERFAYSSSQSGFSFVIVITTGLRRNMATAFCCSKVRTEEASLSIDTTLRLGNRLDAESITGLWWCVGLYRSQWRAH
jgi:hypothetical protein